MSYDPFARGDAPVGVRTIELRDAMREGRQVSIEVWYPVLESDLARTFAGRGIGLEVAA